MDTSLSSAPTRRDPDSESPGSQPSRDAWKREVDEDMLENSPTFVEPEPPRRNHRLAQGTVLLERYEVLSELGHGGMGVVYKCFDRVGGVEVAVKGLPEDVSHDEAAMEDIRWNFQLVSELRHPGITGIRNLEADRETGDYYLVMDLASGQNLRRWAGAHGGEDSMGAKLRVVAEIAAALDYAHSRRVIHRDIKPENVMVDGEGHAHVLDFGLAAQIHTTMSRLSRVVFSKSGTPTYKAPEQWQGRRQDAMTDQYSLGVLAYELIAGYLPFDGDDMAILRMSVLQDAAQEIPGVPGHVNAALARAMAKNPADRFASCGEFAAALAGRKVKSKRSGAAAGRRRRMGTAVLAGVAAVVVAAAAFWLWRGGEVPPWAAIWKTGDDSTPTNAATPVPGEVPAPGASSAEPVPEPMPEPEIPGNPVERALQAFREKRYDDGVRLSMGSQEAREDAKVQFYLGMCHDTADEGTGTVEKDDWTAKTWYERAAAQGDVRAMVKLGKMREEGRAGKRDEAQAEEWYRKAADKGSTTGTANLARLQDRRTREAEEEARRKEQEAKEREAQAEREEQERQEREAREEAERKEREARETALAEEERQMEEMRRKGYTITGEAGSRRADWKEGKPAEGHPHWITGRQAETWRIEDGYEKVDPSAGNLSPLRWSPGWQGGDRKAGKEEGTWLHLATCPKCLGRKQEEIQTKCTACRGTGRVTEEWTCPTCGGKGVQQEKTLCPTCRGEKRLEVPCKRCHRSGVESCDNCGGTGRAANLKALAALFGGSKHKSNEPQYVKCAVCGGDGKKICSLCAGKKTVLEWCQTCKGAGWKTENRTCPACKGRKKQQAQKDCTSCQNGWTTTHRTCGTCDGKGVIWQ
jgi:hypothetical protein